MAESTLVYDPVAPARGEVKQKRLALDALAGKVIGFIDNAKPNFNHLADDLSELLVGRYGVTKVMRHRKRGQVPAGDTVVEDLVRQCDAVITGSGD